MTHKKIIIALLLALRNASLMQKHKKNIQLHLMGSDYMHIDDWSYMCVRVVIKN